MTAQSKDYTDQLLVLVNGEGSTQEATISVNEQNGLYNLSLRNFILKTGETPVPVGNVEMKGIKPETAGNAIFLRTSQNVTIANGDLPEVATWMGPMLGELPVQMTAVLEGDGLRALIDLDLTNLLGQVINVAFGQALVSGTGYHVPNGDFEAWHTSTGTYQEPNAWHSFESASGTLASLAGHHIEKSNDGHNGSACARIFSTSIFGIIANGTMTTGRMNAGAMTATDPDNHAFLDMSETDKDGNGDPFYVSLTGRPDALGLWMKFKQGKANSDHPYATVSAVITDGTRYQEPEDKPYTNVVARASNSQIAVTGDEWQYICIPFTYTDNPVEPRAIMVTVSTNADPGEGSDGDEVFVDDLALIYNSSLQSLAVDGFQPDKYEYDVTTSVDAGQLAAVADGKGAYVLTAADEAEGIITIDVYAADLRSQSTYIIHYPKNTDGIDTVEMSDGRNKMDDMSASWYTLDGRRIASPAQGRLVIVRQADGKVVKSIRR